MGNSPSPIVAAISTKARNRLVHRKAGPSAGSYEAVGYTSQQLAGPPQVCSRRQPRYQHAAARPISRGWVSAVNGRGMGQGRGYFNGETRGDGGRD